MAAISSGHELAPMGKPTHTMGSPANSKKEHDDRVLARLGKKAVLEVWDPLARLRSSS